MIKEQPNVPAHNIGETRNLSEHIISMVAILN